MTRRTCALTFIVLFAFLRLSLVRTSEDFVLRRKGHKDVLEDDAASLFSTYSNLEGSSSSSSKLFVKRRRLLDDDIFGLHQNIYPELLTKEVTSLPNDFQELDKCLCDYLLGGIYSLEAILEFIHNNNDSAAFECLLQVILRSFPDKASALMRQVCERQYFDGALMMDSSPAGFRTDSVVDAKLWIMASIKANDLTALDFLLSSISVSRIMKPISMIAFPIINSAACLDVILKYQVKFGINESVKARIFREFQESRKTELAHAILPQAERLKLFLGARITSSSPMTRFIVDRNAILTTSFDSWKKCNGSPQYPFVSFQSELGFDLGGVCRDWLSTLLPKFFQPDQGRWTASTSNSRDTFTPQIDFNQPIFLIDSYGRYFPNKHYSAEVFDFVGTIFAYAFYFKVPVGVEFVPSVYRAFTNESFKIADLKAQNPALDAWLEGLRAPGVDLSGISFEIAGLGEEPVTLARLDSFIKATKRHLVYMDFLDQLEGISEGFKRIIDNSTLNSYLSRKDMMQLFLGSRTVSAAEFVQTVDRSKLSHEETARWIFEVVGEMSNDERVGLVRFVTGIQGIPYNGLAGLEKPMSFVSVLSDDYLDFLPTVSTCQFVLKLPKYSSKAVMRRQLILAIENSPTFEFE